MTKCEVEKGESYTIIKNVAIRDKRLRHSARGLLVFMLSLPPDWDMTIEGLATISVECADTIRKLINELEAAGYIKRCRERKPDGTFGEMKYYIYQKPLHNRPILKKPILDKPASEKSGQIIKDVINKEETNTDFYNISSINPDVMDRIDAYRSIVYQNIEYEYMIRQYDKEQLDEIVEIMVECICSTAPIIRVGQEDMPTELVRSRFLKIDSGHIEFILDSLKNNTSDVRNIKAYLKTVIYNAPVTINNYYSAKVNHDLYGG